MDGRQAVGLETPDGVKRWDDAEAGLSAALDTFVGACARAAWLLLVVVCVVCCVRVRVCV
jgi:hypothetical protein